MIYESIYSSFNSNDEVKQNIESYIRRENLLNSTEYTINDDLSIDVHGGLYLMNLNWTGRIPIRFGKIDGNVNIEGCNNLTNLKGFPTYVKGDIKINYNPKLESLEGCLIKETNGEFDCSKNKLTSLEGGPKIVEMSYDCIDNQLTTLKGCPEKIGSGFHAGSNKLTEIDFCPKECRVANFSNNYNLISIKKFPEKCIRVDFSWTKLLSLKGLENVEGLEEVYVANSPLVSIFGGRIKDISMIKHFISFKVVDGDTININRLKYFQSIYTEILIRDVSLKAWYKLK